MAALSVPLGIDKAWLSHVVSALWVEPEGETQLPG